MLVSSEQPGNVRAMKFVRDYGTPLGLAIIAIVIGLGALDSTADFLGGVARGIAGLGLLALAGVIFWKQRKPAGP